MEIVKDFIFLGSKITTDKWLKPWNYVLLAAWKKSYDKVRQCIKKQTYHFVDKGPYRKSFGFSSSRVQIWELDLTEGGEPKNWCFRIMVLEKTLEGPLDSKEIKPVNPKGNQLWIFIGMTDAEVEGPMLWPPDAKIRLTGKDPDRWGRLWAEEGATEDEMVGWHHWLNGHEFEQILGESEGQRSLVCYSP